MSDENPKSGINSTDDVPVAPPEQPEAPAAPPETP